MSRFGGGNVEFSFEHGELEVPVGHPSREFPPHHQLYRPEGSVRVEVG